jgi:hypothetical protein
MVFPAILRSEVTVMKKMESNVTRTTVRVEENSFRGPPDLSPMTRQRFSWNN